MEKMRWPEHIKNEEVLIQHGRRFGAEFGDGKKIREPNFRMTFYENISILTPKISKDLF